MTRKDYELIAATIRELDCGETDRETIAELFAKRLATTNPRFDRGRFVRAATI